MHIRPYQPRDEERVIALWLLSDLIRPWNDPRKDIARKIVVQPELFFVLEVDGVVQATVMAGYEGHRGWMNYLAVDPERRRCGFGRSLVAHAEQALLELGCPKLNLQVRASNAAVVEFYRRLGYLQDDVISLGKRLVIDEPPPE